ncbi:hypothetical protein B4U80_11591 [Leptotrombidium deliense]|uniref:Uncharacterized protein n=1 Tax=Leptotrombidium deliense TaxID=299467 RepID=A0A443SGK6_9ACAR|nr:hypothetical protein B4U80_11591 [Leptotrombidium deliense]
MVAIEKISSANNNTFALKTLFFSEIPDCVDSKAVCGYLQLNSFGISTQEICRCSNGVTCPLVWDPLDSRTISHGNDQYKYCTEAPKLHPCTQDDVAFTTYTEMSSLTMETLPPRCQLKDVCMAITESSYSSFITRKCSCPIGMFCPIDVRLAADRIDLDKGSYYTMQCI